MSLFSGSSLFSEDDDDSSFSGRPAAGKSKLGSLFGTEAAKPAGNESLQYNRPKQPKKDSPAPTAASKKAGASPPAAPAPTYPAILSAVGAILYKFDPETQKWNSGGKVGCAVVENKTGATKFQIILYYTKTQIICSAPITANFVYTPQFSNNEHFGNFYDANKQNWSIRFETSDESDNLATYVALAKYIEKGSAEMVIQDLFVPAKGNGVTDGDTVGMRYVLSTEQQPGKLTKVDDNMDKNAPLRLILGQKKGPAGLDAAIEGMRKSGRRLVIVPPGFEGSEGADAKVYKLTLEKLKRASGAQDSDNLPAVVPSKVSSSPQKEDASAGDNSGLSDLPAVGDAQQEKAALLKRIAKMGVATIGGGHPQPEGQQQQEWDGAANETPSATPPTPMQPPMMQQQQQQQQQQPQYQQNPQMMYSQPPQQPPYMQQQQTPYGNMMQMPPGVMNPYGQQQQQFPGMVGPYGAPQMNPYQQTPQQQPGNQLALIAPSPFSQQFLLAQQQAAAAAVAPAPEPAPAAAAAPKSDESSSDNKIKILVEESQVKKDINQKLEKVERRVDDIHNMMEESMFLGKSKDLAPGVSSKQLLVTIQRIVMENEKYAAEMDAKSARIESLTEKIAKLHETNQRVVEENNRFLEERSTNYRSSTESTLKQLEQFRNEKLELEMELTKAQKQFQTLKRAYTNLSAEMEEFKQSHDRAKKEAEGATSRAVTLDARVLDLEEKLRESEAMTKRVQAALDQAQQDLEVEREQVARLTQVMEEHKRKFIDELTRREAQWESERNETGAQLEQLREALRRERAQMGTTSQQIEAELQTQFAAKMKHQLEQLENQLTQNRDLALEEQRLAMENEFRARVKQLREEQAAHLDQANQENSAMRAQLIAAQAKMSDLAAQLQNANIFAQSAAAPQQSDSSEVATLKAQLRATRIQSIKDFETKVKLIMNNVYQALNGEFADDEDQQYNKAAVMGTIRQTIVQTTMQLVQTTQEQLAAQEEQELEAMTQAEIREAERIKQEAEEAERKRIEEEEKIAREAAAKAQEEADAAARALAKAEEEAQAAAAAAEAAAKAAEAAAAAEAAEREAAEEARRIAEEAERASLSSAADEAVEGEQVTLPLGKSVEAVVDPLTTEEPAAVVDPLSASSPAVVVAAADPLSVEPAVVDPLSALLGGNEDDDDDDIVLSSTSNSVVVQPLAPPVETTETTTVPKTATPPPPAVAENPLTASQNILGDDSELLAEQEKKASLLDDVVVPSTNPLADSVSDIPAADVVEEEKPVAAPAPTPVVPSKSIADVFGGDGDNADDEVHPLSRAAVFDSAAVTPATSTTSSAADPLASLESSAVAAPAPTQPVAASTSSAIFDDPMSESVESSKPAAAAAPLATSNPGTPSQTKKKNPIFDDDDEEDFMASITAKANSKPATPAPAADLPKPTSNTASPAPAKKSSLFEIFGDDDDLPSEPKASTPQPASGKAGRKSLDELFGMDDDSSAGSASAPSSSAKPARKKNPLFDDDEEF
eukprot:TRINITY_DN3136_c0_g1_i1.p1 TRINITY_DN3136_c0_g1~~TRINITY_DN3136_c0_g1_i1.p1  ORF type:complete len:1509 (+),score=606.46 TRINITY_DN3136_c0_g1_i1:179-4705(+)